MLVGLRILLVIAIMGGLIAFLGDKIGTKVGKRRMSLFGLRPKHTSIIVTIVTGILISAFTLGILSIASNNVRTALFGMEQLKAEMAQLSADIELKTKALQQSNEELTKKSKQLQHVQQDVQATESELEETRQALASMGDQLVSIQDAYAEADHKLAASNAEVDRLEQVRAGLESHVQDLQITTKELEQGINYVREGNVVFRNGEILSQAVIRPGLGEVEGMAALTSFLKDTNRLILNRFHMEQEKTLIYVSRDNLNEIAHVIATSEKPMMIRVTAAANIIYGEPALAEVHAYPHELVFKKGTVLWSAQLAQDMNAQDAVLSFLKEVNIEAKQHGILPDPITGEVGSLPGNELFDTIQKVENQRGRVRIEAVTQEDTYTSGPVQILLRVISAEE